MKTDGIFEKARLNSILIPAAGAIIAAALVLLAVFSAAYCGAFAGMEGQGETQPVGSDEPSSPSYGYGIKTVDEHPDSEVMIYVNSLKNKDGGIEYRITVEKTGEGAAYIKDLRCMLYNGDVCINSSTIADTVDFSEFNSVTLSGREEAKEADAVVFYVLWEDENGSRGSSYIIKKPGI